MTFKVRKDNRTVRSVLTNSASLSESKRDVLRCKKYRQQQPGTAQRGCGTAKPTLDAVIEGRNRGRKEWKFQRRTGMGKAVL
jgi:hypothetical protein